MANDKNSTAFWTSVSALVFDNLLREPYGTSIFGLVGGEAPSSEREEEVRPFDLPEDRTGLEHAIPTIYGRETVKTVRAQDTNTTAEEYNRAANSIALAAAGVSIQEAYSAIQEAFCGAPNGRRAITATAEVHTPKKEEPVKTEIQPARRLKLRRGHKPAVMDDTTQSNETAKCLEPTGSVQYLYDISMENEYSTRALALRISSTRREGNLPATTRVSTISIPMHANVPIVRYIEELLTRIAPHVDMPSLIRKLSPFLVAHITYFESGPMDYYPVEGRTEQNRVEKLERHLTNYFNT